MSILLFSDFGNSQLAGPISNVSTTANLLSGSGALFPAPANGQYFILTFNDAATGLESEIVRVTNVTGDTITIVRGQEGTVALNWNAGDFVFCGPTAGQQSLFAQVLTHAGNPNGSVAGTAGVVGGAGPTLLWDTVSLVYWVCVISGISALAVWERVGSTGATTGASRLTGTNGAAPSVTATWTVDQIVAAVSVGGVGYVGSNIVFNFNGGTIGAGGMDIGVMPAAADLAIYAIYNPGTNAWNTLGTLGSNGEGPTYGGAHMPAGYTASCLLWVGVTAGSEFQDFYQVNNMIYLAPIAIGSGLTAAGYTTLSLAAAVPGAADTWLPDVLQTSAGASSNIYLSPTATDGPGRVAGWSGVNNNELTLVASVIITPQVTLYRVTSGQTWTVNCIGYSI